MSFWKILLIGVFMMVGFIFTYYFPRQIWFDFATAFPTLDKMKAAKEDLIVYDNAKKYTYVSVMACLFVTLIAVLLLIIIKPVDIYLGGGFAAGAVICLFTLIGKMTPDNRNMFEAFCGSYFRFVPDDQLRTDMYNKKIPAMKLRCHDMGVSTEWIPDFKKED